MVPPRARPASETGLPLLVLQRRRHVPARGLGDRAHAARAHAVLPARPRQARRAPPEDRARGGHRALAPREGHGVDARGSDRDRDEHAHRREERRHDRDGRVPLAGRRHGPPGDARAQARRRHADRVAPDRRDLGPLQRRQGHGRHRARGHRPGGSVAPRRDRAAAPRDQPLHRLGLLDLVHPAARRRDERRPRLGQAAGHARGHDAARQADALPRHEPAHEADDRGRGRRRGRLPLLRAPAVLRRRVHRPRLDVRRRRRRIPGSLLLARARPDVLLGLDAHADDPEGLRRRRPRDAGEGVRAPQQALRPLLQVLLRRDLQGQVLRHGRLRHHDDGVPARHGALLLRRDHADLPLVARPARRAALLRGRRRDGLLPDPLLQPPARRDREEEDGARHLRQPQRREAARSSSASPSAPPCGSCCSTACCAGGRPSSRTHGRTS